MLKLSRHLCVASILFSSLISHAIAQAIETQAMTDVKKLASVEMAGRAIDTPGSQLARDYIVGRLQGLGINGRDSLKRTP